MSSRAPNLINFDKTYRDSIVRLPVVGCLWKKSDLKGMDINLFFNVLRKDIFTNNLKSDFNSRRLEH